MFDEIWGKISYCRREEFIKEFDDSVRIGDLSPNFNNAIIILSLAILIRKVYNYVLIGKYFEILSFEINKNLKFWNFPKFAFFNE